MKSLIEKRGKKHFARRGGNYRKELQNAVMDPTNIIYYDLIAFQYKGEEYFIPIPVFLRFLSEEFGFELVTEGGDWNWIEYPTLIGVVMSLQRILPVFERTSKFFTDCYGEKSFFACREDYEEYTPENERREEVKREFMKALCRSLLGGAKFPSKFTHVAYVQTPNDEI